MPRPWDGFSHVAEDAITDRRDYEQACLEHLMRVPDMYRSWRDRGFELREARLEGHFPDTDLKVAIWVPEWNEEYSENWPIWRGENESSISHGRQYRFSPSMLIAMYLRYPFFESL